MLDRPARTLLLALMLALQLFAQPLAAASTCAAQGEGRSCCCVAEPESDLVTSQGCCSSDRPTEEPVRRDASQRSGCDCFATPSSLPTPPLEAPGLLGHGSEAPLVAPAAPASERPSARPPSTSHHRVPPATAPPGERRPRHLVLQVFLI